MDQPIEWDHSSSGHQLEVETAKFHEFTLRIRYDDSGAGDPRGNDNLTEMVCHHSRYTLGDRTPEGDEEEALNRGGWPLLARYLRMCKGALAVAPLGLYDHSGISMYVGTTRDPWDSGPVGFAFITKERWNLLQGEGVDPFKLTEVETPLGHFDSDQRKWIPGKEMKPLIDVCIEEEVKEYSSFIEGQVYGYEVLDENDETLDSCWGFVGDIKYVKEEAESAARAAYRMKYPVPEARERVGV